MSAAGSLGQSAKRVVKKSGLMGLSAAVFSSRRREDMVRWLRGQKRIVVDPQRVPEPLKHQERSDFGDVLQYTLLSIDRKAKGEK